MAKLTESVVEEAALAWLAEQGWQVAYGIDASPDGKAPERTANSDVILPAGLAAAVDRLNPALPANARVDAIRKVMAVEMPSLIEENRRLHRLIVEGVPVEYRDADGTIRGDRVRLVDFSARPTGLGGGFDLNDWLAINQFTVIERGHTRRPDIVLFVNGLPIAVVELKNPGDENATVIGAYNHHHRPMRGHGLMQAIARVNRVFRDKPAGLMADYIGIAQNLKKALGQYSASDAAETGVDEREAVAELLRRFDVVQAMFHGFDVTPGVFGNPVARLTSLAEALEFILARQHEAAAKERRTTRARPRTAAFRTPCWH